jgi:predicted O-methyltransferase YrrM
MFYNPEPARRWVIDETYEKYLQDQGTLPILRKMEADPHGSGYSDVGTRNLVFFLVTSIRPRRVLEIGTHIGIGSLIIGCGLNRNDYGNLITLEPNSIYRETASKYLNEAGLDGRVTILPQFSTDEDCKTKLRSEGPFELIYIDADHAYASAEHDIALAASLLVDNGLMVLHDVGRISEQLDTSGRGGVRQALYDFCERDRSYSTIFLEHPLWMNSCGAALVCKQRLEPAPRITISSPKERI